jgi:hypothetical protein
VSRALAAAVVVFIASAPAAGAAREREDDEPWRPAIHEAAEYAKSRRGSIAFSVRTRGHHWGWHSRQRFPSASVLKPMLMLAYLDRPGVRDRALTREDKALLRPMITRSDNASASRVLGIVGTRGLRRVARRARMTGFTAVTPIWGNSRITAEDQSRFFLRIDSLQPQRHRTYGMNLLRSIVPSQRWGIARVAPAGWMLYFKGGWGSGTGWVDHQVALLTRGDERIAVAIMTHNGGSHNYGKETLRGVAKWLLRGRRKGRGSPLPAPPSRSIPWGSAGARTSYHAPFPEPWTVRDTQFAEDRLK